MNIILLLYILGFFNYQDVPHYLSDKNCDYLHDLAYKTRDLNKTEYYLDLTLECFNDHLNANMWTHDEYYDHKHPKTEKR